MKNLPLLLYVIIVVEMSSLAQTNKTFFLGHSLMNFHMPNMVNKLSLAGGKTFAYSANIGNGANLQFHWNNPASAQGSPWNTTLPTGGFENFIVTEAIPLLGQLQWSNTYRIVDSLYSFAKLQNPNVRYYIYETWHCTSTGTPVGCEWDNDDALLWRPRLTADLPKWEGIADTINLIHTEDMLVIPAGQALARLYDSIVAGYVPGMSSINQLFADNIHLTYTGNYFVACLMYGILHAESPVGLPNQLTDEWGVAYSDFPTSEQAAIFQRIAWQTICDYPRDGVECAGLTISEKQPLNGNIFTLFPNPTKDKIFINATESIEEVYVFAVNGELVLAAENVGQFSMEMNLSELKKGVYFVKINTINDTFTQKIILE